MAERAPIILLTGPPASGKSTVGRLLAPLAPGGSVYIEGDRFWFYMVKSPPGAARGPNPRKTQMIVRAMTAAAAPYAAEGYETIVDFSIGPWLLPAAREALGGFPLHLVMLCPSRNECARRALTRTEGPADYAAVYGDFYDAFATPGPLEAHMIRDDGLEPGDMARRIREGLDAGVFRLA